MRAQWRGLAVALPRWRALGLGGKRGSEATAGAGAERARRWLVAVGRAGRGTEK
jgi:hypothetical protein